MLSQEDVPITGVEDGALADVASIGVADANGRLWALSPADFVFCQKGFFSSTWDLTDGDWARGSATEWIDWSVFAIKQISVKLEHHVMSLEGRT